MKGLVLSATWDPRPDYQVSEWEKATGKAITGSSVWRNPELKVMDVPQPTIGPDDVLLKVKACGVCGSDLHMYETTPDGYMFYPGLTKFPVVLGHELSGQVVEVGRNVKSLKPGDMVTAEEMSWCGYCTPCRNGFPNQCSNLEEIGFTVNGAFADYLAINAKYCWKINALAERYGSEDKAYEAGATVEPCCVAYNAVFIRAGGARHVLFLQPCQPGLFDQIGIQAQLFELADKLLTRGRIFVGGDNERNRRTQLEPGGVIIPAHEPSEFLHRLFAWFPV